MIAPGARPVHITSTMAAATGRTPEEPLPRLVSEGSEAPEFPVTFSRRAESGRPEMGPNSFRWVGKGTVRLMERGLLVIARRRLAIGLQTTEQRVVPAWEICDVYREGNSVRVSLRGDSRDRDFFQFWTGDAATAGTIVRLLPTERTIEVEYEEPPADESTPEASATTPATQASSGTRTFIALALAVAVISAAVLIAFVKFQGGPRELPPPRPSRVTGTRLPPPGPASSQRLATEAEIGAALATLHRFDEPMNTLRIEFNVAFSALQHGDLPQKDFVDGANRWLIPQWHTLQTDLSRNPQDDVEGTVRKLLLDATLGWQAGLREYVRGLQESNYEVVLDALTRISAANDLQRDASRLIER